MHNITTMQAIFKRSAALFFGMLLTISSFAQTQKVTGKVTDNKGTPLEGVTVKSSAGKAVVTTDKAGNFSINAAVGTTLDFSSIGYESKKVNASTESINVILTTSTTDLQDVILVGSRGAGRVKT